MRAWHYDQLGGCFGLSCGSLPQVSVGKFVVLICTLHDRQAVWWRIYGGVWYSWQLCLDSYDSLFFFSGGGGADPIAVYTFMDGRRKKMQNTTLIRKTRFMHDTKGVALAFFLLQMVPQCIRTLVTSIHNQLPHTSHLGFCAPHGAQLWTGGCAKKKPQSHKLSAACALWRIDVYPVS